jgi:hypothetical protein
MYLDRVLTRTRLAWRDTSTVLRLRLVRGTLDGTPRPLPDSYKARSTRHLDYRQNSDSHDPGSEHSTHSVHLLWDISQSIQCDYLLPSTDMATAVTDVGATPVSVLTFYHPSWDGRWNLSLCSPYHALFCHRSSSREDTTRSVFHDLGDSALSVQPRPGLDVHRRLAGKKGRRGTGLRVFSPSRPQRHHGVRGWPTISEARRYSHLYRESTKLHLKAPRCPGLLLPYKRAGQGSSRKKESRHKSEARR